MSYDLNCYLTPSSMPVPKSIEGLTWQIAVYPPTKIDPEEMPAPLLHAIGGRTHVVNLHVEGQTSQKTEAELDRLITTLIADHDAIIHDLQTDDLISRAGIAALEQEPPKPRPVPLRMTFLYQSKPEDRDGIRARYLDTLEQVAPKSMPRRYGGYEPLPFTYAETGREHFLQDWGQEDWFYFWRGTAPYQFSYQSVNNPDKPRPEDFKSCCAIIDVSPRILKTKKDKADMMELFAALSAALDVYYADLAAAGPEDANGNWRGLPARTPLACCIGQTYAEHWPDFCRDARALGSTHWIRDTVMHAGRIPNPPSDLLAPPHDPMNNPLNSDPGYAPTFPFPLPERPEHSSRR